jgi:ATP-dependent RNA helicase RhlE
MTSKPISDASAPAAVTPVEVTFKDLNIKPDILEILDKAGFKIPTPIQAKVIPTGIEGKDIIGIAQTGTGKTLGFGIPMLHRIRGNKGRGLVVLPTRELAIQVDETLRKIGGPLGLQTAVLIGGDSMYRQTKTLRYDPHVLVATPGRLIDHLKQGTVDLSKVTVLVLDEADHMFDIGFAPQIREIMKRVPKTRQTMLFSATMPDEIAKLAMEHMTLPLRIEVAPAGTAAEKVEQEFIIVERRSRFNLLIKLLGEHPTGPVLVFSRTKHGASDIARDLRGTGITSTDIHSNKSLGQRKMALDGFKKGIFRVLVATDIAARGIDVKDIALVVNYDLPEQSSDYVHRIGRTGRGGAKGKAISFAAPDQKRDILAIERLVKKAIPTKSHEGAKMYEGYSSPRPRGGGYRGRGPVGGFSRGPARSSGGYAPRSGGYAPRSASSSSSYAPRSASSASYAPAPVNKYKAFDKRLTPVGFNKKFRRR